MRLPKKCIATKGLLLFALLFSSAAAWAGQHAGTVINLSGPLLVRKADGTVKVLSLKSTVEQGDTLISEKDTYARIRFADNSEMTLKPNSQIKIDSFSFDESMPEKDSAFFSLVKGGLRAITGLLGKRNNERFGVSTPSATIGIRGTIFIAEYHPPVQSAAAFGLTSLAAMPGDFFASRLIGSDMPASGAAIPLHIQSVQDRIALAPLAQAEGAPREGLLLQVLDGMVVLKTDGGLQNYKAGEFGYAPNRLQPPQVVVNNPGIRFTPPPAFSSAPGVQGAGQGRAPETGGVDCEVR